jgi:L-lactate dehydrogenase complex protein LldF
MPGVDLHRQRGRPDPDRPPGAAREIPEIADIGLSGVNFAVAETGTLCLVENEGNGRMCTTVPPVHIAITGIEKVVEKAGARAPLLSF